MYLVHLVQNLNHIRCHHLLAVRDSPSEKIPCCILKLKSGTSFPIAIASWEKRGGGSCGTCRPPRIVAGENLSVASTVASLQSKLVSTAGVDEVNTSISGHEFLLSERGVAGIMSLRIKA